MKMLALGYANSLALNLLHPSARIRGFKNVLCTFFSPQNVNDHTYKKINNYILNTFQSMNQ